MLQSVGANLEQFNYFDRMARRSLGFTQIPESAILFAGFHEKIPQLSAVDCVYVASRNFSLRSTHENFRGQLCLRARHGFSAIRMAPEPGNFTKNFGSGPKGRPHAYFLESLTEWADERGVDAIQLSADQLIVFDPSGVLQVIEINEFLPITLDEAV